MKRFLWFFEKSVVYGPSRLYQQKRVAVGLSEPQHQINLTLNRSFRAKRKIVYGHNSSLNQLEHFCLEFLGLFQDFGSFLGSFENFLKFLVDVSINDKIEQFFFLK